jgi:hypothetical protein
MDLNRHMQVIWRGKWILLLGTILGIGAALFANYRLPSMQPRKLPTYTAQSKLMLTQNGFPWGRTTLPGTGETPGAPSTTAEGTSTATSKSAPEFADPTRLANLAWMYSHFLMGDTVRAMTPDFPDTAIIDAAPITAGGNLSAAALPLIGLTISAPTAADAQRLSTAVPAALETYLRQQQQQSKTPDGARVEIAIVNKSLAPLEAPSKAPMMAIVIVMMALAASVALVYVRENLRMQRGAAVIVPASPEKDRRVVDPMSEPLARPAVGDSGGWASGPPPSSVSRISNSGHR